MIPLDKLQYSQNDKGPARGLVSPIGAYLEQIQQGKMRDESCCWKWAYGCSVSGHASDQLDCGL